MPKWKAVYNRSSGNFFIYEDGKSTAIMKTLGVNKEEQQKIVTLVITAVNRLKDKQDE